MKNKNTVISKDENEQLNENSKSFANGLNFYKLFWIFFIACFFGVIVETLWCVITNGYFESRTALILFPLNPIYGFGAVLMTLCFAKRKDMNPILLFILCMIVGGAFEYFCSLFQEIIFGTVSWYYEKDALGISQRTSLIYSIYWGVLGIAWVNLLYPLASKIIEKIPNEIGKTLTCIIFILVIIDIIFTSCALFRQEERRNNIPATNSIQKYYDNNYNDEVLKKIYPHMTVVR